jgi:hypothetical protein
MKTKCSKILVSVIFVLFSWCSLFAVEPGAAVYFTLGGGLPLGSGSNSLDGEELSLRTSSNTSSTLFKDPDQGGINFNLGLVIDTYLTEFFGISTGLSYEHLSETITYAKDTATDDYTLSAKFNYITIPIGIRLYSGEANVSDGDACTFIGIGYYYGILLSDKGRIDYPGFDKNVDMNGKNDHGMYIDAGVVIYDDHLGFIGYFRYKIGMASVYEDEDKTVKNGKLGNLSLNMGYGIKF